MFLKFLNRRDPLKKVCLARFTINKKKHPSPSPSLMRCIIHSGAAEVWFHYILLVSCCIWRRVVWWWWCNTGCIWRTRSYGTSFQCIALFTGRICCRCWCCRIYRLPVIIFIFTSLSRFFAHATRQDRRTEIEALSNHVVCCTPCPSTISASAIFAHV